MPITGKSKELDFAPMKRLGKYDLFKVAVGFACIFITLAVYIQFENIWLTVLVGIFMYFISNEKHRKNESQQISEPDTKSLQFEIADLKTEIDKIKRLIEAP
jgi:hypothetical protein